MERWEARRGKDEVSVVKVRRGEVEVRMWVVARSPRPACVRRARRRVSAYAGQRGSGRGGERT